MKLEAVRQALRSIPRVEESTLPPSDDRHDVMAAVAEFSKLLRKLGIQQTREVREILSVLQNSSSGNAEQIREAWHREQQRAAASEQQLRKLADTLISTFDVLDRMQVSFASAHMDEWELQAKLAIDVCLHDAEKAGLVPLGNPGEPFDASIHDLTREVGPNQSDTIQVGAVANRGYALNGKVLRRAAVDHVTK